MTLDGLNLALERNLSWKSAIQIYSCDQVRYLTIDPLQDPVTWYKITHAGEQVAQWDFQNNATRTSP